MGSFIFQFTSKYFLDRREAIFTFFDKLYILLHLSLYNFANEQIAHKNCVLVALKRNTAAWNGQKNDMAL